MKKISVLLLLLLRVFISIVAAAKIIDCDINGTPVEMTNEKGNVVWRGSALPFGEDFGGSGSRDTEIGYCGKPYNANIGLYDLGARYYDPNTGRFTSVDPVMGDLENPQRLNSYAYGLNSPYRYVDPDGGDTQQNPWTRPPSTMEAAAQGLGTLAGGVIGFFIGGGGGTLVGPGPGTAAGALSGSVIGAGIGSTVGTVAGRYISQFAAEQTKSSGDGGSIGSTGRDSSNINRGKVDLLADDLVNWVGKDAKVIKNPSNDTIIISNDGTKRLRFDINNPSPHKNPHFHIEELISGEWQKSGPVYPQK